MPAAEVPRPRGPLGSPAVTTVPLTLHELAVRAGHAAWFEARLFEVVGGWVTSTPEPHVLVHLAAQSRRHGGHAELWGARLPEATIVDAEALTSPSSEVVERLLDEAAALEATEERLGILARVLLPALLSSYDEHRDRTSPVCDGATIRTLDLVSADLRADLAVLERLAGPPRPGETAGEKERELADALDAAGGPVGALPVPV